MLCLVVSWLKGTFLASRSGGRWPSSDNVGWTCRRQLRQVSSFCAHMPRFSCAGLLQQVAQCSLGEGSRVDSCPCSLKGSMFGKSVQTPSNCNYLRGRYWQGFLERISKLWLWPICWSPTSLQAKPSVYDLPPEARASRSCYVLLVHVFIRWLRLETLWQLFAVK